MNTLLGWNGVAVGETTLYSKPVVDTGPFAAFTTFVIVTLPVLSGQVASVVVVIVIPLGGFKSTIVNFGVVVNVHELPSVIVTV